MFENMNVSVKPSSIKIYALLADVANASTQNVSNNHVKFAPAAGDLILLICQVLEYMIFYFQLPPLRQVHMSSSIHACTWHNILSVSEPRNKMEPAKP